MKRTLVLLALLLPTIALAEPHKRLDLRKQTDAKGEYNISLCARPSEGPGNLPGHAFVLYSFRPVGKERQIFSLGYTTNSAVKGILSYSKLLAQPAGYLGEEIFTSVNEKCLVLLVNESAFNDALKEARPFYDVPSLAALKYTGVYSLTRNDCITFMTRIANKFEGHGVQVPKRNSADLPLEYIRRLIDSN